MSTAGPILLPYRQQQAERSLPELVVAVIAYCGATTVELPSQGHVYSVMPALYYGDCETHARCLIVPW